MAIEKLLCVEYIPNVALVQINSLIYVRSKDDLCSEKL